MCSTGSQRAFGVHNPRADRGEISADEQGYTVTEWTVMKSQQMNGEESADEQGYKGIASECL